MNLVFLSGNIGGDAELRNTQSGKAVLNFTMATTEKFKDKELTEWHRCTMWGPRAEKIAQYLTKGTRVIVNGSIRSRKYEKDGQERIAFEINVNDIEFSGARRDGDGGEQRSKHREVRAADEFDDDNIPF